MTAAKSFTIGSPISCCDGASGELVRVVVDPVARVLTHLVVELTQRPGAGRLVPVELVDSTATGIELRCSCEEFDQLLDAQGAELAPGPPSDNREQQLDWPYYGLADPGAASLGMPAGPPPTTYDRVPRGDVELRRGEPVQAKDGSIGRVQGVEIDLRDQHLTHVLLDEGHLWRHRRIAVPIQAVTSVEGGVHIDLTKHEVRDLPAVER